MPTTKTNRSLQKLNSFMPSWFANDRWLAEKIGLTPNISGSSYYLNFSRITSPWFKELVKKFVLLQSSSKSYASCLSYVVNLSHFGEFINEYYPSLTAEEITRTVVLEYIHYLAVKKLSPSTRHTALTHLRTLHMTVIREKWGSWPLEPLLYNGDIPSPSQPLPRFIPDNVIAQLKTHLTTLPSYLQNLITILIETGRRISEVCGLAFDCLEHDSDNSAFLKVNDNKTKKHYLIPLSKSCLIAITQQQSLVRTESAKQNHPITYLFPTQRKGFGKNPYVTARGVNTALNELSQRCQILDDNGVLWHFHAHQFRHTIGTRMINAGVPQAIVQRYLGHESPEMTSRYAYIHHETLKKSFQQFQSNLIDVNGAPRQISSKHQDAFILKQHIMAQALPNGICGLPLIQQRCPHANACLTCSHFRTHKDFLPQHEAQLLETNKIIENAKNNGWQRHVEMNLAVKQNLEKIISRLKEEPDNG